MIKDYLEALKEGCIELGNTVFFYVHLINTSRTDCENEHCIQGFKAEEREREWERGEGEKDRESQCNESK